MSAGPQALPAKPPTASRPAAVQLNIEGLAVFGIPYLSTGIVWPRARHFPSGRFFSQVIPTLDAGQFDRLSWEHVRVMRATLLAGGFAGKNPNDSIHNLARSAYQERVSPLLAHAEEVGWELGLRPPG